MQNDNIIVVGCGIAGLSAAVSAAEVGAKVTVLERAPKEERGGNTRWTEAFMRMKNDEEVSEDFFEHFAENAVEVEVVGANLEVLSVTQV